jgi:hypothetical protein
MAHTTVRITEEARELLREMAEAEGSSMQSILQRALEDYRRHRFLDEVNAGFSQLREIPGEWRILDADRGLLDAAISDGLPQDEVWTDDGRAVEVKPKKSKKKSPRRRG